MRYDPEQDDAPHSQIYTVPHREDWVVLDAINYIKDELDRTLDFRRHRNGFRDLSQPYLVSADAQSNAADSLRNRGTNASTARHNEVQTCYAKSTWLQNELKRLIVPLRACMQ